MKAYWEGNLIRLRLFKSRDKTEFFYKSNYCCYMNNGHIEWEPLTEFPNFDSYFNQNHFMHFENNFSLIIALSNSDSAIGITQVYDTNTRNGTYFMGIYFIPEFDLKEYYLEVIKIIKNFMFNELRYNEGFISLSDDQKKLLDTLKQEQYEKSAQIKKRYNNRIDQHIFRIKK
jgi:RimJ/RimL family protein N-acetyltransferase